MINKNNIIDDILAKHPILPTGMMSKEQIRIILKNLKEVLDSKIEGDIVELGCHGGSTSLFIQRLLKHYNSEKEFHVYDSFLGLPDKQEEDETKITDEFFKGRFKSTEKNLILSFKDADLAPPIIHVGWFKDIPDQEYPEKIAFAFFDGDFYSSIIDSFNKVYPRLSKGARICIDDYKYNVLPGVEKACRDFLKGKPEEGAMVEHHCQGILVKK